MPAVALALLACVAAVGAIPGRLTALSRRRPHATGVVLGAAWRLRLWPSIVGLVIVLACAVATGRARVGARK
jgi:uncharacterized membrane protein